MLYVPDYISLYQRVEAQRALFLEVSGLLPGYEIQLAISEGPFEDDDSVTSHFELKSLGPLKDKRLIDRVKVDLHTSVVKLARDAAMHKPRIIIGKGQGGLVAIAYSHPGCLEKVLASRNVQPPELPGLSQAWGTLLPL